MSDYQMFEVQVSQVEPLTEQVKRFTLVATDGKPLPAFTGGSHVIVQMSDGDNQYSNAYSLLSSPHDPLVIRLPFGWRKTRAAVPAFCISR